MYLHGSKMKMRDKHFNIFYLTHKKTFIFYRFCENKCLFYYAVFRRRKNLKAANISRYQSTTVAPNTFG